MKNNNSSTYASRNNQSRDSISAGDKEATRRSNSGHQQGSYHDKKRQDQRQNSSSLPHQQPQQTQHQQQQQHQHQQPPSDRRPPYHQRDHSGHRERSGQYPDSSVGRESGLGGYGNPNLGSVKFTPGYPTRELPPIETKADPGKKFTGRCRLFVGNLAHNTTEERVKALFEPFGEIGEMFLGPKSAFAFVKMDTRQNAEAARDALDCSIFEGRQLRVRLAAHAAAIRVKHLPQQVTNELLAYAFRYFGEIERAVVVVDDKGRSTGEGIVEYSRKQSAQYAIKRCQQECFILTATPKPVLVEPFDQQDDDEGLPEKSINRNSIEFKEQRDVGPRFAEQGTFEHTFAQRWKELYAVEKQKRERLELEIQEARQNLQDQIEYSRLEHDTMQLRSKLQQLEDNRMKLQQMKEQSMTDAQQRDEHRRQQDMLIKQREEDILRRQQLGDPNGLIQQESILRSQAHNLQTVLTTQETAGDLNDVNQSQQKYGTTGSQMTQEMDQGMSVNQMMGQPPRTFADVAMMGMNQQPYMHVQQQTIGLQPSQTPIFTGYIPPPPLQGSLGDASGGGFASYQPQHSFATLANKQQQQQQQPQQPQLHQTNNNIVGRPTKFVRQGNNVTLVGNSINSSNPRPRKRGRF